LYTRPEITSEPHADPDYVAYQRAAYRAASNGLPSTVHDLSHIYDSSTKPYFFDDVHTNEAGAALVAEAIYDQIRPLIAQVTEPGGGGHE
jgi:lysophospholipase L1-like esterase